MSLLESTLEKITSLLRIGFGEAGANIIKVAIDWLIGCWLIDCWLIGCWLIDVLNSLLLALLAKHHP